MAEQCFGKLPDGSKCADPAVHWWGNPTNRVCYCCAHFSILVQGIFDLQEAVRHRTHRDLVNLFEDNARHSSKLMGMMCKDEIKTEGEQ